MRDAESRLLKNVKNAKQNTIDNNYVDAEH